jgi:hypothetical protein
VDEVKDIRNKAEAMCAYARMAKDKQLEIDAAEIRARATRWIGEMMAEQPKNEGGRPRNSCRSKLRKARETISFEASES